jgi:hypothetical protein
MGSMPLKIAGQRYLINRGPVALYGLIFWAQIAKNAILHMD